MVPAGELIDESYDAAPVRVREDLREAHRITWAQLAAPGTWWTGPERRAIAEDVRAAFADDDPLPPWVGPSTVDGRLSDGSPLPDDLRDALYRLTRHAGTLTEDWYRRVLDGAGITAEQWVEAISIVISLASIDNFARLIGAPLAALPEPTEGEPSREHPPVRPARHNWVPVLHLEDAVGEWAGRVYPEGLPAAPPVVRALSSVPEGWRTFRRLSDAQYLPMASMGNWEYSRGTIDRRQIELLAGRISVARECFY